MTVFVSGAAAGAGGATCASWPNVWRSDGWKVTKLVTKKNTYWVFSLNGGTPKSSHFNRVFHYKPSILGYPYFWKHPYGSWNLESMKYLMMTEIKSKFGVWQGFVHVQMWKANNMQRWSDGLRKFELPTAATAAPAAEDTLDQQLRNLHGGENIATLWYYTQNSNVNPQNWYMVGIKSLSLTESLNRPLSDLDSHPRTVEWNHVSDFPQWLMKRACYHINRCSTSLTS